MTAQDVVLLCYVRGVRLVIKGEGLRAQARKGTVNDVLKKGLAKHKREIIAAYGDGVLPDETLPDEIVIPTRVPNRVEAIKSCIDAQRKAAA